MMIRFFYHEVKNIHELTAQLIKNIFSFWAKNYFLNDKIILDNKLMTTNDKMYWEDRDWD